jgi:hypothetical protein
MEMNYFIVHIKLHKLCYLKFLNDVAPCTLLDVVKSNINYDFNLEKMKK